VTNLRQGITTTGNFEVKKVDKLGVNLALKPFKYESGSVNFGEIFKIPLDQRIKALAEKDLGGTIKIIAVAITLSVESMNLSRPMTPSQIIDLSEIVAESAGEDNLTIPDLLLFLQKLVRGEYGSLYESIDIPKFMLHFNSYRDERWAEGVKIRDQKTEEYKRMGEESMFDRMYKKPETVFEQHLKDYSTKIQAKNDEIKELRKSRTR